jgi:hypothetical protein
MDEHDPTFLGQFVRNALALASIDDCSLIKKNATLVGGVLLITLYFVVESAGIEPASANPLQQVLHT